MLELLATIALLCQVPNGLDYAHLVESLERRQLKCQQEYLRCVEANIGTRKDLGDALASCLIRQKIK